MRRSFASPSSPRWRRQASPDRRQQDRSAPKCAGTQFSPLFQLSTNFAKFFATFQLAAPDQTGLSLSRVLTRTRNNRARLSALRTSVGGAGYQFRRDEALQPAGVARQARPVVEGKIDDNEARGRQFLDQAT